MTCGISIPLGQYIGKHHAMYDKKLPNIIFHYTNLHGIVGIVESKTFWLTKASYLNDYSEVNFFIDRLNYMINNLPTFGVSTELLDSVQKIILQTVFILKHCIRHQLFLHIMMMELTLHSEI